MRLSLAGALEGSSPAALPSVVGPLLKSYFNIPSVNEATLRYGKVTGGLLPATGKAIQTRAALSFATLLPSLSAVVYTVATGTTGVDGLYVTATLPFSTTNRRSNAGRSVIAPMPL
jgi:hypothetical protein